MEITDSVKSADLVVELGFEEIPAWMLESAAVQFADGLSSRLKESRLACAREAVWYTPRRFIVGLSGIAVRQEDLLETVTGPPKNIAFDSAGAPTKAAISFAQKNGIPLRRIRIVQTPRGEYLTAVRKIKGEATRKILQKILPEVIGRIQFPKSMHWSPDKFRFARPLRWIVALFDGKVVKFALAGIVSSNRTSGHRFMGKGTIAVDSLAALRESLMQNGVIVECAAREARIREGLEREATAAGGDLIPDEPLLKTVANLNEFPSVIHGAFEERFLSIPKEILVTVMREHQKYFSVSGALGELLPAFLAAVNLEAADSGKIRAGHERVLRARLADAAFFWETDRKVPLMGRLDALRSVLFQEKLGSYFDKTQRLLSLLPEISEIAGCPDKLADLETACRLSKCDLVTEMVKEFTDLQGVVGGLYARAEGYPETIWRAVYEQYLPKATTSASPLSRGGAVLALADRLDTVCGCFSIGLIPKGSGDPFGVRRQANGVIKILLDHKIDASMENLIRRSLAAHRVESVDAARELKKFFEGRLRFLLEEQGYSYDCLNAAFAVGADSPVDTRERVAALQAMHGEADFLSVASNFKRIVNILAQASDAPRQPEPARMTEEAESFLWRTFLDAQPGVEEARRRHDYLEALRILASMRQAVDGFFDKVLVMAEDPATRQNRLALLSGLSRLFLDIADISQIVLEK